MNVNLFQAGYKKHISHVVIMRWICSVVLEFHGCLNAAEFLGIAAVMEVENLAGTNLILASTFWLAQSLLLTCHPKSINNR